jgi:hypothetical protein
LNERQKKPKQTAKPGASHSAKNTPAKWCSVWWSLLETAQFEIAFAWLKVSRGFCSRVSSKNDPIRPRRVFQLFKRQSLAAGPELGADFQDVIRIGSLEFPGTIPDINFVQKNRGFRVVQLPENSQNRMRLVIPVGNDSPGADDAQGDYYRNKNVFHIIPLRGSLNYLAHGAIKKDREGGGRKIRAEK